MATKKTNTPGYLIYKSASAIVCIIGLELPTKIIKQTADASIYQLIFAYAMWLILPLAAMYFVWQIITSGSYKSVYPFKWFFKT